MKNKLTKISAAIAGAAAVATTQAQAAFITLGAGNELTFDPTAILDDVLPAVVLAVPVGLVFFAIYRGVPMIKKAALMLIK